jgi:hypothetical protein
MTNEHLFEKKNTNEHEGLQCIALEISARRAKKGNVKNINGGEYWGREGGERVSPL